MDPTFGLADKFRDLVLDQIWEQFLYLVCYGQNIEQLTEQLAKLTLRREAIQHRVDEDRNNVKQIEGEVLRWLHEVDTIFKQVEELHKESQAKRGCSITSCSNPWLRYKLSKSAKEMVQKVSDIYEEGKFDRVSHDVPPPPQPKLTNEESNEGIGSRVLIMNQIMEAVRNPSIIMIGLCGSGGVGKTTIVKEVEMKEQNHKMFGKVIRTTISDEVNIKNIQGHIAEKLGMQLNENFEDTRACRLCERLKQERNMLLILDDLWVKLDLHKVGIPLVEGHKILLTSRNETLLSTGMKCQKIIKVGVLLEDEALELFKRIAKLSFHPSNPDLISIATEIVRRCQGLPLAIGTAAKALEENDLNGWKDYLERLKHLRRNYTGIKEVDASLKLSYDPLSQENKNIFLLSAMLSHDPSIEDLLMYSVGLDFLEGIENIEEAHVRISTVVSKLKSLNLFLSGSSNHRVMIHDVFREVALSIAPDELHALIVRHKALKEWPDKLEQERYKGICLQQSDIGDFPEVLYGPRLEFFLLNSTKHDFSIPSMFFKSSKELKVLAFTNMHFPSLPSLSFLKKLKALCLHSCVLVDITEVGCLRKLKVLSLANSEIERLPAQLVELTSLLMLNLSHCSNLKVIPPGLLSSLKKLEVLYMGNSFNQWKVEGCSEANNENASLEELRGLPISSLDIDIPHVSMLPENLFLDMSLKRYKIFIGECWAWRESWAWQGNDETSKILKVKLESSIHLTVGVPKLLEGVEDLYLYGSNAHENVLHGHEGRGFPHLRYLRIDGNHEVAKNVYNKTLKSFFNKKVLLPKLEILELCYLWNMLIPWIWDDQLSHNSFNKLKVLVVQSCCFVKLVPLHVLKSLNNLEEVEVKECDMLEIVFDFEVVNDYDKEVDSSSVVVPLKKLKLSNLRKLKNVWSNNYQGNISFPSLRSIHVFACESLTSIFPALSVAKGILEELEVIHISNCSIDVIVAKDQVSESVAAALQLPRLTSLKLYGLPQLTSFYPERHTIEWPHLQRLSIEDCDELEIFEKEVSSSSEIYEEESTLNSKYPLFSHKVIHNLDELNLAGKPAEMIGSGQFPMYLFPKVKLLDLFVGNATTIVYRTLLESFPNLEELQLRGPFVEAFGGDDVAALASPFPKLIFNLISITGSLSPLLVSSPNLTHIEVIYCYYLTTLMTSSTARSLVHLTHLTIGSCGKMEEIITKQEGENDEDKEIVFSKLKILVLDDLRGLKRFCGYNYTIRFPLLDQLVIKECPSFTIFSRGLVDTPSLESIQLSQDGKEQHEVCDYDLNKTLYLQRSVVSREVVLDEDDASMIRNEQFPQAEILCIRRFVQEGVTFPYTLLERFPKLNELLVEDSSFEEILPSLAHIVDRIPPFKELSLVNLDQLKNIFPSQAPSSTSFHNLIVLKVSECHHLVYLVTCSTAKSLVNLETLEIYDCEKLEEIVRNETDKDVEGGITFNGLRILKLARLPRLNTQENKMDFKIEDRATNTGCTNISRSLFSQKKVLLPKLETLKLFDLLINGVSLIWGDQHSFSNLKTLIVIKCDFKKLVPLCVLKSLNNLEKLKVSYCHNLEMVFGYEDLNDYHKEMESASVDVPLSLTHLEVIGCRTLPTLMTSLAAPSLVHITHLSISDCNEIEEIITKQEGEDDEDREIIFNQMKFLELDHLPSLKRFCRHNYTFRFPLLDELIIKDCPKFKIFSPGLIETPSLKSVQLGKDREKHEIQDSDLNKTLYCQRQVTSGELVFDEDEVIMIRNDQLPADCFPQVEILGIEGFVEEWVTFPYPLLERFPKLNALHVDNCSFEEIFPSHAPSSTPFHNLTVLKVSKCHQLVYLVTCSNVKSLVNLETLEIDDCEKMEEIVRNDNDEDVEGGITFNGLRILNLTRLPKLKTQEDKKDFNVEDRATNTRCINISRSLFNHNKVLLPKLETLELSNLLNNLVSLIWDGQLLHNSFSNLKTLIVKSCNFMKLLPLHVLKSLNNLEKLEVSNCDKLEMVFGYEDFDGYHKELESSSVVVPLNLTHLEVKQCCGLTTLMTSSAAASLVHITHLSISNCYQIEEIITKQEGGDDEDREIIFNQMKFLKLDDLPRLKRFCGYNYTFRFPLWDKLVITRCPKFKRFSPGLVDTPSLESVQLSQDWGERHEIWDTNLNKTFYQQRFVASREVVLDEDDAIMIRNDQFPADWCPQVEILGIEGFVEEWVTFPYTLLERFPKMNALHVENCSFEEIFPSHAPSSTSFHNLTVLKVSKCHHLVYLVTCSAVKSLVNLETLEIDECEKLEEIVRNETDEDVERGITFNGLRILKLTRLPKLKTQEDKKDFDVEDRTTNIICTNISRSLFSHNKVLLPKLETLELSNLLNNLLSLIWDDQHLHNSFSNLKTLIVKSCDFMKLVPFHVLKSLNNLENLEFSHCDKLEMVFGFEDLNDYHKEMESSSVVAPLSLTHLEVNGCDGLTTLMTSSAAASLVHITHLVISNCDQIEEIITKQEIEDNEDKEIFFNEMKFMELDDLPRLKRFCGYNYTFRFPLLEHVTITECPQLTMFCLGVIHAPLLQSVRVNKYERYEDIWMTNLNNTIQHLFTFEEVISTCSSMALNPKNITMIMDVFPNVSTLYVQSFIDEGVTFPYSSLERFPQLYNLYVEDCSFGEIFPSQDQIIDFKGKISPFKDLWWLSIFECHQLIHLMTTSTAKNLVCLRWLEINYCKQMEEIVKNDTNEDVKGGITFNQLLTIKLIDMPSLKMFSPQSHTLEFPELEEIEVIGCPEMKMFCWGALKTPKLCKVKIEEHDMEWKDKGDLNKIMKELSSSK